MTATTENFLRDETFTTNVKGLPEGRTYYTEIGYSQTYVWVEVKRTAKTVTVAPVEVTGDAEWADRAQFHLGGFAAHCANQEEQTWVFSHIDESHTRTLRVTKTNYNKGQHAWTLHGVRYVENRARHVYDYNF